VAISIAEEERPKRDEQPFPIVGKKKKKKKKKKIKTKKNKKKPHPFFEHQEIWKKE